MQVGLSRVSFYVVCFILNIIEAKLQINMFTAVVK